MTSSHEQTFRKTRTDDTGLLMSDLFLNLVVVLLILVGSQAGIAAARASAADDESGESLDHDTVILYVTSDGGIRMGEDPSELRPDDLVRQLQRRIAEGNDAIDVLIVQDPGVRAETTHNLLSVMQGLPGSLEVRLAVTSDKERL